MMPLLAARAASLAAWATDCADVASPLPSAARARFRLLRREPSSRRLRLVRLTRCRARLAADTWFAIDLLMSDGGQLGREHERKRRSAQLDAFVRAEVLMPDVGSSGK